MLVLTCAKNESITIGADVTVIILENKNGKVRFGIEAPKSMIVDRKEVYDKRKSTSAKN